MFVSEYLFDWSMVCWVTISLGSEGATKAWTGAGRCVQHPAGGCKSAAGWGEDEAGDEHIRWADYFYGFFARYADCEKVEGRSFADLKKKLHSLF
jgi:hypothetical protein